MDLPSRLQSTTVGDLLGALHRENASGSLELEEPSGKVHRVHVSRGRVTSVEVDRASASLAEILRSEEAVAEDVLRRSLLRALASQRLHGDVLTSDFGVPANVVDLALRRQLKTRLAALDHIEDARVRFRVAVRAPRGALAEKPLQAPEFLHGRRRARDRAPFSSSARPETFVSAGLRDVLKERAVRLLGLTSDDPREAKVAYRRLARELHPDLHPQASDEERARLSERFSEVTAAYKTLVA
ncbi:MAG: J domain-containing protein [Polyangiaceae bacterium]